MLAVFQKEISLFLNSLIAYIVIGVFLTGIGLLTWIFPDTNVLDYGYASLDTLFDLGPYVLMFLIPAITMRTLAEERKTGTIELLLTRPLTDWDIVFGKFLASWVLVIFSILPTLIYYISVYQLGNPTGNIDTPGIIGFLHRPDLARRPVCRDWHVRQLVDRQSDRILHSCSVLLFHLFRWV